MTNKELIEILSQYPEDALMYVTSDEKIGIITKDRVLPSSAVSSAVTEIGFRL